jgi:hypothetical protein
VSEGGEGRQRAWEERTGGDHHGWLVVEEDDVLHAFRFVGRHCRPPIPWA